MRIASFGAGSVVGGLAAPAAVHARLQGHHLGVEARGPQSGAAATSASPARAPTSCGSTQFSSRSRAGLGTPQPGPGCKRIALPRLGLTALNSRDCPTAWQRSLLIRRDPDRDSLTRDRGTSFILRWSTWRRRHRARAELSHYQRRDNLRRHPSHQLIAKQTPQDQFEVLLSYQPVVPHAGDGIAAATRTDAVALP